MLRLCSWSERPFFNTQRVHFVSSDSKGWYMLPYLVGSMTTHLVLDIRSDGLEQHLAQHLVAMKSAFSNVLNLATNLKTLVVKVEREHERVLEVLAGFIASLPFLRKIQVPLGSSSFPHALYHLASSTHLVFADLTIYPGSLDLDQLQFPSNAFPNLCTLYFTSKISLYTPFIRSIRSSTLNSVRLTFHEHSPCPTETFHTLIQATCSATSSLHVFELTITAPTSHRQLSNLPTAAVLLPLFAHRKLEELVIDFGVSIQLTDADIDTIVHMWPSCRKLRLIPVDAERRNGEVTGWMPKATPRGIIALLYHLEELKELAVEFDASSLDANDIENDESHFPGSEWQPAAGWDGPLQARRTSPLEMFDVGKSAAGDPLKVAGWLGVLCPRLEELRWTGDSEGWARTRLVLRKIQQLYGSYAFG
ncbi:hypothetical protein FRC17_007801 [Serendipita sp. 399]|nr:hypothetical protein FRC17_007801 [Serendipita sp. 399]